MIFLIKQYMGMHLLLPLFFLSLFAVQSPAATQAAGLDKFLALGTSSKAGVYYPVGKAICSLLNENRLDHRVRATAYNTGGSVYNIQALASEELDVAITRSDLVYKAYNGLDVFEQVGANHEFRLISVLYGMPLAVIVKDDSGITDFSQLSGNRINLGNLGSGKRTVADLIFKAMQWTRADFSEVSELSGSKAGAAFCNGELDIIVEALGIPATYYDKLTNECGGRFLNIPPDLIASIIQDNAFFKKGVIPGGMYPHNPEDVLTFTIDAVLITSDRVHPKSIFYLAEAIFHDLERFKNMHPALGRLLLNKMITAEPFIPYHDGVLQYFNRNGLMPTANK